MVDARDQGFIGRLVSLGGVKGREGLGYMIQHATASTPVGGGKVQIIPANSARACALITNVDAVRVYLSFVEDPNFAIHPLDPGGSFQIDEDFPWTGGVWMTYNVGVATVGFTDISVQ